MRRLNLCVFSLITAGLAAVVPAAADDQPVDVSATARMISMPSPNAAVPSDSNYKGLEETSVIAGLATPGVPCANCVAGADTPNIGLPWPVFTVQQRPDAGYFDMVRIDRLYRALHCQHSAEARTANLSLPARFRFRVAVPPAFCTGSSLPFQCPTANGLTTVTGLVSGGTNKSGAITLLNVR